MNILFVRRRFCKNVSIDEMSGTIRIDTKRFVGTLPHPTMPSVDYTECSEDDFQKMVMIPGDPLGTSSRRNNPVIVKGDNVIRIEG